MNFYLHLLLADPGKDIEEDLHSKMFYNSYVRL